ncbi:MAG: hypothetical protein R2698_02720 [Microthrixaceae bacterium]
MVLLTVFCLVVAAGCTSTKSASTSATTTTPTRPAARRIDATDAAALAAATSQEGCDELDAGTCLLPFPSDRFTVEDKATETGRRVELPGGQIVNTEGVPLDVTEWNRNDGFSPGSPGLIEAPGVDLEKSGTPPLGDIGASMRRGSTSLLIDLTERRLVPHWVEVDQSAPPGTGLLVVRPATSLKEGHHIGIVLGRLVDSKGVALQPSVAFRVYRDNITTDDPVVAARRPAMEALFAQAAAFGARRSSLYAAWDFTVASARNLSERMLTMRDDAFERLGTAAPAFHVGEVVTTGLPDGIGRRVRGTFEVPSYLTDQGAPGSRLVGGAEGRLPSYSGSDYPAEFTCQIPTSALSGKERTSRPVVYGHGLLGSMSEAENSQVAKIASTNNMVYCATNWIGMSKQDVGTAVTILGDLSKFPSMPDRSQQGMLNTLFLARLMRTAGGFVDAPEFANDAGKPLLDTREVYFDGNSQGSIMGGAVTAVSAEWTKAVLGVPGMNYALLLSRSVDFEKYFEVLNQHYPDRTQQMIIYDLISMLWDRAETNGYAQHLTESPYPGTPRHQVVLDVGFGDHQVSTIAAEVEARTIGAAVRFPALAAGRSPERHPFYGLDRLTRFPTRRSVLIYWDSGTLPPPLDDITPAESPAYEATCTGMTEDELDRSRPCADSHEDPRRAPGSIRQKDEFFRPNGRIIDPCEAKPCTAVHRAELDY